jgi:hypothetical protein
MATDSAIDVSGLQGVERPMSDNFLTFKPFGNEFADQPLQRNAALRGQQLTVDLRQSGTLNGTNWIGTPLANLAGFATSVSRTIDQLLTTGGNVTLSSPVTGDIVLRQGSSINVGGGTVHYAGDSISATRLFTADGRIVSISRADPLDTYIGIPIGAIPPPRVLPRLCCPARRPNQVIPKATMPARSPWMPRLMFWMAISMPA